MLSIISITFIVVALFTAPSKAQITCPPTTRDVLTLIYDQMGGANWTTNNWFSNNDPCTWTGIECNSRGEVSFMDLSGMNLTGPVSDAFECLPLLKSLYLNNNSLTGSIPTSICTLEHLSYLQIRSSGITGSLPTCLCDLKNIMFMYFSNNGLTGTIPTCLSTLGFLRELHLDCNNISGTVPTGFATQLSLEELWVNCNPSLTCPVGFPATLIFKCGDTDCTDCGINPGNCPTCIEVEGCGQYCPLPETSGETFSSKRKPQLFKMRK
eukprot:gnl/Chilomastix_caulleri/243.p1 GENE.gnl/Chilomastix_caulleri/243~~gnl/Chilomastix_caulleri/243.p1  ORF type:complete len:267 (+),score=58.28 gnl/Chilomastix_caulleri/243:61-861(+)